MATEKSNGRALVAAAERNVFGVLPEMQSLIAIYRGDPDAEAYSCLAANAMERFSDAFDEYHHLVVKHGRPKVSMRPMFPLPAPQAQT